MFYYQQLLSIEWYIDVFLPQHLSCHRFCFHQEKMSMVFDPYWHDPLKYMCVAFSLNVFTWSSDIDLRSCSGFFCEARVFPRNNILFLRQNPANPLADILKVSTCSGYVSLMIRFVNHHLLINLLINLLYNSFSIIGNITFTCCVDREVRFYFCFSSSLFT